MDDVYDTIRRNMNSNWPIKLPKHKKILELFKLLWPTEEEAKIVSIIGQPLNQKDPKRISKITGIPVDQVIEICEKMIKKGLIYREGKKYMTLPMTPGVLDYYFITKSDSRENLEKVAKLWCEIENSNLANELNSEYPLFRTLPASSLPNKIPKTIEIDEDVGVQHEILVYEDVEKYIKQASSITLANCVCRTIYSIAGISECEKPINTCIFLNFSSDVVSSFNAGKKITQDEALEVLKNAEDNGLVHTIINGNSLDTTNIICNCCSCHCLILGGLIKHNLPNTFARSNFRPEIDNSVCKKCEQCIQVCPMKAIWHHWPHKDDLSDDFIEINEHRCIGCGLCAHHCSNNAITMKKVYNNIPEDSLAGVLNKVESKKGH